MCKVFRVLFLFVACFSLCISVYAADYSTKELIDVNSVSTVKTELFVYNNITFVLDSNNNKSLFHFDSVTNVTHRTMPASINILLFDKEKKNIGFLTYCSKNDIDNSQIELKSNTTTSLEIKVADKYFVDGHSSKDVAYYSVYDENPYCHVGGYDKYKYLTIEEIKDGKVTVDRITTIQEIVEFLDQIDKMDFRLLFVYVLIFIISYIVTGIFLNELNKRMYVTSTPIAYIPIGNNYLSMKLAFGTIIASIYLICLFVSFVLFIIGIRFLNYILIFISCIAFLVDLIKLITRKYDLFLFEPISSNYIKSNTIVRNKNVSKVNNRSIVPTSTSLERTGNEIIDLNYSDPEVTLPENSTVNTPIESNNEDENINDRETK